ncbi:hypothetical protein B0H16DRAFT_1545780 [Mycena metata]|uniref:Xylanolytic transcriptional activator regulatory domain-containing protein n=1 Tax=Mycena metata TaxID=1033252 RepID=A0AAD7N9L9_9AGAR|nr:hypothetical protein B0H16DRAFT_1545780 [Mycena metata]
MPQPQPNSTPPRRQTRGACDQRNRYAYKCTQGPANANSSPEASDFIGDPDVIQAGKAHVAPVLSASVIYIPSTDAGVVHQMLVDVCWYARSLEEKLAGVSSPDFNDDQDCEDEGEVRAEVELGVQQLEGKSKKAPRPFYGPASSLRFLQDTVRSIHAHSASALATPERRSEIVMQPWPTLAHFAKPSPQKSHRYTFPPPALLSSLLSIYFTQINPILDVLHAPTVWQGVREGRHLRVGEEAFGGVVLGVCAVASRYSDDPRVFLPTQHNTTLNGKEQNEEHTCGWAYFRQIPPLRYAHAPEPSLEQLQLIVLSLTYLAGAATPEEVWLLVSIGLRLAQAVGLPGRERDGTVYARAGHQLLASAYSTNTRPDARPQSGDSDSAVDARMPPLNLDLDHDARMNRSTADAQMGTADSDEARVGMDTRTDAQMHADSSAHPSNSTVTASSAYTTSNKESDIEAAYYHKAYRALCATETMMCVITGRPSMLRVEEGTSLPSPDVFYPDPDPNPADSEAYARTRARLMGVFGRIERNMGNLDEEVVARLDSELNEWVDGVPGHLKWNPHQENALFLDQSAALYALYYHAQILIHRPFIPAPGSEAGSTKPHARFPSLAICANAARACGHVLDVQVKRGRGLLHIPHVVFALFDCAILLLVHVWDIANTGKARTPHDLARVAADAHACVRSLRLYERRWPIAAKKCAVIAAMLDFARDASGLTLKRPRDLDLDLDSSSPRSALDKSKRLGVWDGGMGMSAFTIADADANMSAFTDTSSTSLVDALALPTSPDASTATLTDATATDQLEALEASIAATNHLFALPLHSEELGRLPVYEVWGYGGGYGQQFNAAGNEMDLERSMSPLSGSVGPTNKGVGGEMEAGVGGDRFTNILRELEGFSTSVGDSPPPQMPEHSASAEEGLSYLSPDWSTCQGV